MISNYQKFEQMLYETEKKHQIWRMQEGKLQKKLLKQQQESISTK